jgi:hypothetical protein
MDDFEKKKKQEEMLARMKERMASNGASMRKGIVDDNSEYALPEYEQEKKKSQWSNLAKMFGG